MLISSFQSESDLHSGLSGVKNRQSMNRYPQIWRSLVPTASQITFLTFALILYGASRLQSIVKFDEFRSNFPRNLAI
jgi:hypothetical protein